MEQTRKLPIQLHIYSATVRSKLYPLSHVSFLINSVFIKQNIQGVPIKSDPTNGLLLNFHNGWLVKIKIWQGY